MKSGELA